MSLAPHFHVNPRECASKIAEAFTTTEFREAFAFDNAGPGFINLRCKGYLSGVLGSKEMATRGKDKRQKDQELLPYHQRKKLSGNGRRSRRYARVEGE